MIWIFGDSFSANSSPDSWVSILSQQIKLLNYSANGSSEYRIWKNYQHRKERILPTDIVIFCHTSPSRIFLKNNVLTLSRLLGTHAFCDLIFNDVFSKKETTFIKILKTIWDEEFFCDTYNLYVNDLKKVPNSIHITFFELTTIESFYNIWTSNKGKVNHMDKQGNLLVAQELLNRINFQGTDQ